MVVKVRITEFHDLMTRLGWDLPELARRLGVATNGEIDENAHAVLAYLRLAVDISRVLSK